MTTVKQHFTSGNTKDIISKNSLVLFTTICNSKSPEIVDRIRKQQTMLKNYIWLKTHVENIATKTSAFELNNMQEMVNQVVHSSTTQRFIDGYSKTAYKTAYNMYAALTTREF